MTPTVPTRELFERHGLRCTRQRVALYEALRACMEHPTAEELHNRLQPAGRRVSRATVYNTLEALCKAGLARRLPTPNGCCRYDGDLNEHLHVHVRDSGEILDVPQELGGQLLQSLPQATISRIEREMGVKVEGVIIQLVARNQNSPSEP